jgi:T5SS/PEP-CTERM-associated repeat protein
MVCNDAVVTFTATSTLNDASGLIVGNDSVGTLIAQGTQSGYSTLHTVATKIGRFAGSNGTMTIDGAHWDDTQSLFVGLSGAGTLNVLDGGQVAIGTSMVIGRNVGATGAVSLASGADVSVGSWLKVGGGDTTMAGGTGSLAVGATAVLNAAGPLVIEPGSDVTLTGGSITLGASGNGLVVSAGSNLSGFGAVTTTTDSIFDAGTITATGGTLALSGAVAGGGVLQIGADSTLRITGASIGKLAISFSGADGSLDLAHGVHDSAILAGFAAGDTLAMAGINSIAWNSSSDILTLSANGQVVDTLKFAGSYSAGQFTLTQSGGEAIIGLTTAH